MSFLNPLLFGCTGNYSPIVAHLLNRFEYEPTGCHAVPESKCEYARNIKLRDLLLLLLRCVTYACNGIG